MFTVETVDDCPHTRGSKGVLQFTPELIGEMAGLVRDKIEWILLLQGERSTDGWTVKVTDFIVPPQRRSSGHAELIDGEVGAITLEDNIVGVMHSHHTMGAFFSGTDTSSLNPRFPTSIVLANKTNALGFDYKAVGKVKLPCGSVGEVYFQLSVDGVTEFTFTEVHGIAKPDDLGDCNNFADSEQLTVKRHAACGLSDMNKPLVFGVTGAERLKQIEAATVATIFTNNFSGKATGNYERSGQYGWGAYRVTDHRSNYFGSGQTSYLDQRKEPLQQLGSGKKSRKQRKRERQAARREAAATHPTSAGSFKGTGTYVNGFCDFCEASRMLKWHDEAEEWLCSECYDQTSHWLKGEDVAPTRVLEDDSIVIVEEGRFTLD